MARRGTRLRTAGKALVALALGAGVLWWLLPRTSGVSWSAAAHLIGGIAPHRLAGLTALWACGLLVHSFVLTGALPGLSRRRALTLSLTGSAVSNVAPMGGALGVALNCSMARTWRFRDRSFAAYLVVTNAWDVLAKLALPLVALVGLLAAGGLPTRGLRAGALAASLLLLVLVAAGVTALRSDRVATAVARFVTAAVRRAMPRSGAERGDRLAAALLQTRLRIRGVVSRTWPQLTLGMAGYLTLLAALLWSCLHAAGAPVPVYAVLAGLAVERLLSLTPVTPGGTGLAEAGTAGTLVALGASPLPVVAGVLLYRAFTFVLEIPVGGLWLGLWLLVRARAAGTTGTPPRSALRLPA
ncbi:lysylphosphatidylglycerol synthase domain-containing protein [Pedococcus sp. 2YAF34]|uniref:lysylphosphatidylglycerol synthase domain-containing protein n=1 Tax=Pedococcus sp. 2YAF34 TaxID=3233032 RepID=UPI003F9B2334